MPHAHFCPDCRRAWSHARMACPYYRVEDNGVRYLKIPINAV